MGETINTQLYILLLFIISGILIGVLFDIFRILRKSFKTPDILTYLEDVVFWILTGSFLLYLLFTYCNGEIRIYPLIGLLIGITIYILTLSKHFIKINVKIITFLKDILKKILNIILFPLKIILRPFSFLVINLRKNISNFYKKIKYITKKSNKSEKIEKKRRNLETNVEKYKYKKKSKKNKAQEKWRDKTDEIIKEKL